MNRVIKLGELGIIYSFRVILGLGVFISARASQGKFKG
jgi:hypothetical protein